MPKIMKKSLFSDRVINYCLLMMKYSTLIYIVVCCLCSVATANNSYGQKALNNAVTIELTNVRLSDALDKIAAAADVKFAYSDKVIDQSTLVTLSARNKKLGDVLQKLLSPNHLSFTLIDNVFILKRAAAEVQRPASVKSVNKDVRGAVSDSTGVTLVGVSVSVKDHPNIGTSTDINGKYILNVPDDAILVFKYVGYAAQEIPVGNQPVINVVLKEEGGGLNEVVVVGFGTQKKITSIGAQSTLDVKDLKQPVRNLTTMLAGRISGIVAVQRSGEPGNDNASLWVRGVSTLNSAGSSPLILVDGVDRPLANIDPEDIESFSILKDASATAVYGVRGANGVILVTTKQGKAGKPKISLGYNQGVTQFVNLPEYVDGPTYMEMANEANTTRGRSSQFSDETIAKTRSGEDPYLYPNVNWMDQLFNKFGANSRLNTNVSGGSENANFYVAAAYYTEEGLMKTDELANYNSKMKLDRYNFTSNLNLDVTRTTKLKLGLQGYIINSNYPGRGTNDIFGAVMGITPIVHPPKYPDGKIAKDLGGVDNPYSQLTQTGYTTQFKNQLMSNIRLTQDLAMVTSGLSFTTMFSFDAYNEHFIDRTKTPDTWIARSRDANGELIYQSSGVGSEFLNFSKTNGGNRQLYTESAINYNRTFGKHDVGGLLLYNQSDKIDGFANNFMSSLPFRNRGVAGRSTYAFDNKYMFEFNFGYNGSENFIPKSRYGFFPSIGLGWVASQEKFFEPLKDVFQLLKFRFSHGLVGNSNIDPSNNRRFAYIATVNSSDGYTFGLDYNNNFGGRSMGEYAVDVSWEKSTKTNFGIDFRTFQSSVYLQLDFFNERREGIFLRREGVPTYIGVGASPYGNLGITENKGIDATFEFNKKINQLDVGFRGTFTYAHSTIINDDRPWEYPWRERKGLRIGKRFGYIAEGLFTSAEEIANSAFQTGNELPGDIKFKDINGDGVINLADEMPIGFGSIPEIVYGFGLTLGYKGFSMGAFFQGVGNVDIALNGGGFIPFQQGISRGNLLNEITNRWTPENPSQDVFYPRLAIGDENFNYRASSWWMKNGRYLRLKTLEVGYQLPDKLFKRAGLKSARIYALGYNVLTLSPFKLWDVELGDGRGTVYPQLTTYSLGIDFKF
jgi:TonB-linked SusC/RagA family outer membrane protein